MQARKKLTNKLTELGYSALWTKKAEDYQFTLYIKNKNNEIGSPFKQILIQDFEGNNGFEVFNASSGSNSIDTTIKSVVNYTNSKQKRPSE